MVQFLSIIFFLGFIQFLLGFLKFPFFLCHSVYNISFLALRWGRTSYLGFLEVSVFLSFWTIVRLFV